MARRLPTLGAFDEHGLPAANALSIPLFLGCGLAYSFADGVVTGFQRVGLGRYRRLTESLEVVGAVGRCAGLIVPVFTIVSAAGLALLILLGVLVIVVLTLGAYWWWTAG